MDTFTTIDPELGTLPQMAAPKKRSYAAAEFSRLFSDWWATNQSADSEVHGSIITMRARVRDLRRSNSYVRRYQAELVANTLGDKGITTTPRPKLGKGKIKDAKAAAAISAAWAEFSERENFSADRRNGRVGFESIALQTVAGDGEMLMELHRKFNNRFGFAVSAKESDWLDINDNNTAARVKMGISYDAFGGDLGYRLKQPQQYETFGDSPSNKIRFLPAEMAGPSMRNTGLLPLVQERFGQTRGTPWIASALRNLRQLDMYEEAALVAARAASSQMGFLIDGSGDPDAVASGQYGQHKTFKAEASTLNHVHGDPEDFEFKKWDPSDPNGDYEGFRRGMLRGISSGILSNYASIANDYSSANYSSMRAAALSEREIWKMIQCFWIDSFERPIYRAWLKWSLTVGAIPGLSVLDFDRLADADFDGRRWAWVDPLKDINASEKAIALGIDSRQGVARSQGKIFAKVMEEQEEDNKEMDSRKVTLSLPAGNESTVEVADDGGE